MMNETAQQNMENHPVIRTLRPRGWSSWSRSSTQQNRSSPGSRDYTLLNYLIIPKPSAKRAFKYIQVRNAWKGASFFFFLLKYSEWMCDSFFSKKVSSGRPVNKEDALPAPGGTASCCQATSFLWPPGQLSGSGRDGSELTSFFKGCRSKLKGKHNQLLYSVAYGNYKII